MAKQAGHSIGEHCDEGTSRNLGHGVVRKASFDLLVVCSSLAEDIWPTYKGRLPYGSHHSEVWVNIQAEFVAMDCL